LDSCEWFINGKVLEKSLGYPTNSGRQSTGRVWRELMVNQVLHIAIEQQNIPQVFWLWKNMKQWQF